jgi:hypothetical protein
MSYTATRALAGILTEVLSVITYQLAAAGIYTAMAFTDVVEALYEGNGPPSALLAKCRLRWSRVGRFDDLLGQEARTYFREIRPSLPSATIDRLVPKVTQLLEELLLAVFEAITAQRDLDKVPMAAVISAEQVLRAYTSLSSVRMATERVVFKEVRYFRDQISVFMERHVLIRCVCVCVCVCVSVCV